MKYYVTVGGRRKFSEMWTLRDAKRIAKNLRAKGYKEVSVKPEDIDILPPVPKKNKFNAERTELDGLMFDSAAESRYYAELLIMQKAGLVQHIKIKPEYTLLEAYPHPVSGKVVQGIVYEADFLVTYTDGRQEVIDVKSPATRTGAYKIKKKLFEYRYGIEIKEIDSKTIRGS